MIGFVVTVIIVIAVLIRLINLYDAARPLPERYREESED